MRFDRIVVTKLKPKSTENFKTVGTKFSNLTVILFQKGLVRFNLKNSIVFYKRKRNLLSHQPKKKSIVALTLRKLSFTVRVL